MEEKFRERSRFRGLALLLVLSTIPLLIPSCGEEPYQVALRNGMECQKSGDVSGAIKHFEKALSLKPDLTEMFFELAKLHFESGDYEEAQKYVLKTIKAGPGKGEAHLILALIHQQRGDLKAAEEVYKQALKQLKGPESAIAYATMGYLRYVEAMKERAREEELSSVVGDLTEADKARRIAAQKFKEAEEALLLATQKNPDLFMAHYNLGNIYLDQYIAKRKERFGGAAAGQRKEKEIAFLEEKRAALKEILGKAVAAYEKAVALSPSFAEAHRKLGIIYDSYMPDSSENLKQKTIFHFEKYLELGGTDKEISERLNLLRKR